MILSKEVNVRREKKSAKFVLKTKLKTNQTGPGYHMRAKKKRYIWMDDKHWGNITVDDIGYQHVQI